VARRVAGSARRWAVLLAVAVAAVALAVVALDRPSALYGYRVIDEHTVAVTSTEGPGAWTRVGSVVETASSVTITIRSVLVRLLPGTAEGIPARSVIALRDPIDGRQVIDGSSGAAIPEIACPSEGEMPVGCP
jgi:hypothetical protein